MKYAIKRVNNLRTTWIKIIFIFCLLSFLPLFLLLSCRHTNDGEGVPPLIQHRYWNYYERGLAFSLLGKWEKAAHDFQVAMGTKEGALYPEYQEKRRSKTYGVRFLDNYFPHRELGICYYFLGNLDEAKKELDTSLSMLPSSRAKYYMNKVRSAQFSQLPSEEASPLTIDMEWSGEPTFINRPNLTLKGLVMSKFYVNEVKVNDERELIELAEKEFVLNRQLTVSKNKNPITITATDLAGNNVEWKGMVIVDFEGPEISVSPSKTQPKEAITVDISDNNGIRTLTIDGKNVHIPDNTATHSIELRLKPSRKIKIEVQDKAGNKTRFQKNTRDLRRASIESIQLYPDRRLAFQLAPGNYYSRGSERVAADASSSIQQKVKKDEFPPTIRLQPDIPDQLFVTTDYYVLDINVADRGIIQEITLTINGKESLDRPGKPCTFYRFSQIVPLIPGTNLISVTAKDRFGNESIKEFEIIRKAPHDQIQRFRMTLASQLQLANGTSDKQNLQRTMDFTRMINQIILSSRNRRFNLVDRSEEVLARLALEQTINHSPLKDYRLAVTAEKLRPAEWYLKGVIAPRGGEKNENWEINGELIDVLEGIEVTTSDTYIEGNSPEDIEFALRIFVDKFLQQLPLHSSMVGRKKGSRKIIIPLGANDNIKQNLRFMFVSGREVDAKFSEPLMSDDGRWIQGIVTAVDDTECLLEVFPQDAIGKIEEDDWAFMR